MKPRALMITGGLLGLFSLALSFFGMLAGGSVVFVFASGALFGKGYGVWEERSK